MSRDKMLHPIFLGTYEQKTRKSIPNIDHTKLLPILHYFLLFKYKVSHFAML